MPAKREKTRKLLLAAALALFAERGWRNTATAEISKRAGVATGTLFNHFPTKENLLCELFLSVKAEQSAAVVPDYPETASPKERIRYTWQAVADWAVANPKKHKFICDCKTSGLIPEEVLEQSKELFCPVLTAIEEAVATGEMRDIPRPLLLGAMGALHQALVQLLTTAQSSNLNITGAGRTDASGGSGERVPLRTPEISQDATDLPQANRSRPVNEGSKGDASPLAVGDNIQRSSQHTADLDVSTYVDLSFEILWNGLAGDEPS